MAVNALGSGSNGAVAATSYTTTGVTQPTPGAYVLIHNAVNTGSGVPSDAFTSVTFAGATFTYLGMAKADPSALRNVLVYGALIASPTAAQLVATFGYTADGFSYEIVEETAYAGTNDTDGVLTLTYRPTATNANSETGWMLKLQSESNRLVHFASAGANSYDLTIGAGETGWTRHANVSSSSLISLGVMSQVGSGDLSPTMDWIGTAASPTVIDVELLLTGGASTTYPIAVSSTGEAGHGTNGTAATSITTGNLTVTGTVTNGSAIVQVTAGIFKLDPTFVGASISGTNIPGGTTISSVQNDHQFTMSANATPGSGSVTITCTGLKHTFTAGRAYLIGILGRRVAAAAVPTSVATTGGALTFTAVGNVGYNSDFNGSMWKLEAASTVTETVVITWAASHTAAWQIVELPASAFEAGALVTANVVTNTATSATSVSATMGSYAKASNGVVAFMFSGKADTPNVEGGAVVVPREDKGSSNRFVSTLWARNNVATIGANFTTASVGIVAAEISAPAVAAGQPSRSRMVAIPHARTGRGGPVRIGG